MLRYLIKRFMGMMNVRHRNIWLRWSVLLILIKEEPSSQSFLQILGIQGVGYSFEDSPLALCCGINLLD